MVMIRGVEGAMGGREESGGKIHSSIKIIKKISFFLHTNSGKLCVVAHTLNPSTWEAEKSISL